MKQKKILPKHYFNYWNEKEIVINNYEKNQKYLEDSAP